MESTAEAGGTIATDEDNPGEPPPPPASVTRLSQGLVAGAEQPWAIDSSASFRAGSEAFPSGVPAHSGMFAKVIAAPQNPFAFLGNALQMSFKYKDDWLTESGTWRSQFSTLILHMHLDGTTNGGVNFRNRGWHGVWQWMQQDQCLQVRMHYSAQDRQSQVHCFYRQAVSGEFILSRSCGFNTAQWDTSMELHRTMMLTNEGWRPVPPPPDHPIIKDVIEAPVAWTLVPVRMQR